MPPQAIQTQLGEKKYGGKNHKPLTRLDIFTHPVLVLLETARSSRGRYTSGPSHSFSSLVLKDHKFLYLRPSGDVFTQCFLLS